MALNDILEKIKKEAKKKVEEIEKERDKRIKEIEADYHQKIEKKKKEILEKVKKETEKKVKQAQIKLSLATKNAILAKKRSMLDNFWQEILDYLVKLPEKEYLKIVSHLLEKCPKEKGKIVPAQGQEKIIKEAIDKTKRDYTLSKAEAQIRGGFIYRSELLEIDASFEALVRELREKLDVRITKILFE